MRLSADSDIQASCYVTNQNNGKQLDENQSFLDSYLPSKDNRK